VYREEEYARSTEQRCENRTRREPTLRELDGGTVTTTEVADLPSLEAGSGLRKRDDEILIPVTLRMVSKRTSCSSSLSAGRALRGTEWMAYWFSFGARRNWAQGDSPTGKD
jgi:hypothetical protein